MGRAAAKLEILNFQRQHALDSFLKAAAFCDGAHNEVKDKAHEK